MDNKKVEVNQTVLHTKGGDNSPVSSMDPAVLTLLENMGIDIKGKRVKNVEIIFAVDNAVTLKVESYPTLSEVSGVLEGLTAKAQVENKSKGLDKAKEGEPYNNE